MAFVYMEQEQQPRTFTFPFKLYEMVEHAHESGFTSALSWLPSGNAFFIHDKNVMMNDLAPMFFKQTKYRSFTRQLYIWGFERIDPFNRKRDCWQHKYFLRGRPDLLEKIVRIEVKSSVKVKMVSPVPTSSPSNSNSNSSSNSNSKAQASSRSRSARSGKATYAKIKCVTDTDENEGNSRARADSQASQCGDEPFTKVELMFLAEIFEHKNKNEGGYPSHDEDLQSILSLDREAVAEDFVGSIFDL